MSLTAEQLEIRRPRAESEALAMYERHLGVCDQIAEQFAEKLSAVLEQIGRDL